MSGVLGRLGIDRPGLMQAARLAFAAWLAFAIATIAGIPHAYWAAMPIWVVVQPSRGLLIERAVWRLVGTIIGAAAGFLMLKILPGPVPVIIVLAGWVGGAAALVHLVRGVQSYGVLLAGMTAGIVVLPTVLAPDGSLDLALARVACTLIGVVVVTLVMAVSTPWAHRGAYYAGLRALGADAARIAGRRVVGEGGEAIAAEEAELVRSLSRALAEGTAMAAGSMEGYRRFHGVNAMLVTTLAVLAQSRVVAARKGDCVGSDALLAERLRRIGALDSGLAGEELGAARPSFSLARLFLSPARDSAVARESGLVAGLATLVASLAGLASGWAQGELAALGVCIFSMVMTSLPSPRRAAPLMVSGVAFGVVAALAYRFLVQPHIASEAMLVLSIAPFVLVGGLARVSKRTAIPAIDANMCFLLASQPVLPMAFNPAAILSSAMALLLGALLVGGLIFATPDRTVLAAERGRKAIRRDLERIASATPGRNDEIAQRRLVRLAFRILRTAGLNGSDPEALVATFALGDAITMLKALEVDSDADRAAIGRALAALAAAPADHAAETLAVLAVEAGDAATRRAIGDVAIAYAASAPIAAGFGSD